MQRKNQKKQKMNPSSKNNSNSNNNNNNLEAEDSEQLPLLCVYVPGIYIYTCISPIYICVYISL